MHRELRGSRDPAAECLALLRSTPLDALEMGDRRDTSLCVTFDLSWDRLEEAARRALAALACAPGDFVSAAATALTPWCVPMLADGWNKGRSPSCKAACDGTPWTTPRRTRAIGLPWSRSETTC